MQALDTLHFLHVRSSAKESSKGQKGLKKVTSLSPESFTVNHTRYLMCTWTKFPHLISTVPTGIKVSGLSVLLFSHPVT